MGQEVGCGEVEVRLDVRCEEVVGQEVRCEEVQVGQEVGCGEVEVRLDVRCEEVQVGQEVSCTAQGEALHGCWCCWHTPATTQYTH